MKLSKEQKAAVETKDSNVVVVAASGSGKALENGSLVYKEDGPIAIEKLRIGDKVYGEDGELHNVIGIFPQGKKKKYQVKFTDGTIINCCNEHLWSFQTASLRGHKSKTLITASLQEIIDEYPLFISATISEKIKVGKRRNIFIPMTNPVNFPKGDLPLKPYCLGALLGDGCLRGAGESSIFTNEDLDVVKRVSDELGELGISLSRINDINYAIVQNTKMGVLGPFNSILKDLSLAGTKSSNKFIPDMYKYSSVEDRVDLLRGLIDTDGYCEGGSYDYVSKSKQLVLDIKEVCESLGLTAVYSEKKAICTNAKNGAKDCGNVFRLRIKVSEKISKIHFSQKRENQWKPSKVYSYRAIEEIIETNEFVEMTCISVDNPSKLFLTNNFIVTHNTRVLTERVKYLIESGVKPENIFAITYTNMASQEMEERLGDCARGVFIGTIHSLANKILLMNNIPTFEVIDEERFDDLFRLIKTNDIKYPRIQHLLVDEFQDITKSEYEFIFSNLNPENFFVVGDSRQAIYGWKGSNFHYFNDLVEDFNTTVYQLTENYRSAKEIGRFGSAFLSKVGDIIRTPIVYKSPIEGRVENRTFYPSDLVEELMSTDNYGDWFILTRTNAQLDSIVSILKMNDIPCESFKKSEKTLEELKDCMNENTVKVLTIHSAKGLEAKNVAVIGARYGAGADKNEELRICYVAATRAKNTLIWYTGAPRGYHKKKTNDNTRMVEF